MPRPFHREVIPLSEVPRPDNWNEMNKPVVLVVDDEPLIAESLSLILSAAGFVAMAVYSATEALTLADAISPAFLLTDVHMPGMNGVQLAMKITSTFPHCKVLLFSGSATPKDLAPATQAGMEFSVLAKPIHPTQLIAYIWESMADLQVAGIHGVQPVS